MDLYALLGVTRAASAGEIERAYRRLARRYHPGMNPGDRAAEEMFRRVQHAFDVLGDLERRREYDRAAAGRRRRPRSRSRRAARFRGFRFFLTAEGPTGRDVHRTVRGRVSGRRARSDDAHARRRPRDRCLGCRSATRCTAGTCRCRSMRQERCGTCRGDGRVPRSPPRCVPHAAGRASRRWARGHMVFTRPCDDCEGTGRLNVQACRAVPGRRYAGAQRGRHARGAGRRRAGRPLDGSRAGQCGRARRTCGRPVLTVDVALASVLRARRTGSAADAAAWRCTRPRWARVSTCRRSRGRSASDSARARRPAAQLRIRGQGYRRRRAPARTPAIWSSDIQIVLPPVRDERSKELLREFGRLNDADVRGHLFRRGSAAAACDD